jgi:hypothetical protein
MREEICSGFSSRFLEEYDLLEKYVPSDKISVLAYHPEN